MLSLLERTQETHLLDEPCKGEYVVHRTSHSWADQGTGAENPICERGIEVMPVWLDQFQTMGRRKL